MLKWLNYTETDYKIELINENQRKITVKQSNKIIYFDTIEQTNYNGIKKTKKLLKEGFVLKIDTLEKYKDLLNVDIGRNYAFAEAIARDFNKYWTFSKIDQNTIDMKEFARTVKLNFQTNFYEILFRYKHKPLREFCDFLKIQLSKAKEVDQELLKIVANEIEFADEKEDIVMDHFILWVKHWEIIKESDLNDPRLVKLVNWYQKKINSNLRVLLSNIEGSGYGLFTNTQIPAATQICDYGGNVSRTHINEFETDQNKSAYTMTIKDDASVLFYGWTVDSKTCFSIWQVGRWGNALPLKKDNNAQFETYYEEKLLKGFPSIKVYSTKDIPPYSEIYIDYGPNYDLKTYQEQQELKKLEKEKQKVLEREDTPELERYFKFRSFEIFKEYAKEGDFERDYNLFKDTVRESYDKKKVLGIDVLAEEYLKKLYISTGRTKSFWKKFAKNDGKKLNIN